MSELQPLVSVLLPTYNRSAFLPAAVAAIRAQTFSDWELVVVDDGSTDDTEGVVGALVENLGRPVRYVKQANAGAYGARNTALDSARGTFVAFYDSDDSWLPHHLAACVTALERDSSFDWVYASCRIVDYRTGREQDPDTFRVEGTPRPFLRLGTRACGEARIFDDPATIETAVIHGLYCGLQNSVIRRSLFDRERFHASYRNEAEDQLYVIRALKRGQRVGYIDAVHVQYHVHDANSSAPDPGQAVDRQLAVYRPMVRGFQELRDAFAWTDAERRALSMRIGRDLFWHIGYAVLWNAGRRNDAIEAYRAGLREWPWSAACWKTYVTARARLLLGAGQAANES